MFSITCFYHILETITAKNIFHSAIMPAKETKYIYVQIHSVHHRMWDILKLQICCKEQSNSHTHTHTFR